MDPSDVAVPADLACAVCRADVDQGYAPVSEGVVAADDAVCATCGWGEVGMNGCAPELGDFAGDHDALVRLAPGDDGPTAEAVTDGG